MKTARTAEFLTWEGKNSTAATSQPILEWPRRRAPHARLAVVQESDEHGISTRKVDSLVKALGVDEISKSDGFECPSGP